MEETNISRCARDTIITVVQSQRGMLKGEKLKIFFVLDKYLWLELMLQFLKMLSINTGKELIFHPWVAVLCCNELINFHPNNAWIFPVGIVLPP